MAAYNRDEYSTFILLDSPTLYESIVQIFHIFILVKQVVELVLLTSYFLTLLLLFASHAKPLLCREVGISMCHVDHRKVVIFNFSVQPKLYVQVCFSY